MPRLRAVCVLSAAAALSLSAALRADIYRNLTESYADTKAAMEHGAGNIVCIGDSLTYRAGALFDNLRPMIQDRYGNGGTGYRGCSIWSGAQFSPANMWLMGSINTDVAPYAGLDGMWAQFHDTTAGWMTVSAYDPIVTLHYTAEPTGSPFIVRYPDGTFARIPTYSPTPQVRTLTVTLPPTTDPAPVIRFEPQPGGTVTFLGTETLSQQPGPRLHRAANGGWGVNAFLRRNWTFDQSLAQLNPSLFLVMLGQNDGLETRESFGTKIGLLVDRLRAAAPQAEVVLISSYDAGANWNAPHALGMEDAAISRNTGFINLYLAGGNHAYFASQGFLDTDGVHWTAAGGHHVAQLIFDALESGGRPPQPCTDLDFNNDSLFPDTADIDALLAVFSGGECPPPTHNCDTIDFNGDGIFPDVQDVADFLNVFAGGACGG